MIILGISGFYHDAAAAIVDDGVVVAAAQEERFTRVKHDAGFPVNAIEWCLAAAGVEPGGIDAVAYYDKPITTFMRVIKTYVAAGPKGLQTFHRALPEWLGRKLWISYEIDAGLRSIGHRVPGDVYFSEHHLSHAAAAFYPSPFESACVLTFDGVGEWATSSIGVGRGNRLELVEEMRFPDSLGLLYSAFTYQAGFRVNSGEYKLMGLAPFGSPVYAERITDHLIDLAPDGSFTTDMRYFDYLGGRKMTNRRFDRLFDGPPRLPDGPITQRDCDLASSIQEVTSDIVLRMATHARQVTGERRAVLAGGVALNSVANGRLLRDGPFDELWIQPAAGDAGSAIGCALWAWHEVLGNARTPDPEADSMFGALLGPSFDPDTVAADLEAAGRPFRRFSDPDERAAHIAGLVDAGGVVGLFQGAMEFGPRALGNRSIIGDPRSPDMQRRLNEKIKHRESFRPFAPAVLAEHCSSWFDLDVESPYMLLVAPVAAARLLDGDVDDSVGSVFDRVSTPRSTIPAVTHVDNSARVQTVDAVRSPAFHRILSAFHELTGCPVMINTSFNVRGEPIVCTPEEAYRCFITTDMDHLVLEDCVLDRGDQPAWHGPDLAVAAD